MIFGSKGVANGEIAERKAELDMVYEKRVFGGESGSGEMIAPSVNVERRPSGCNSAREDISELRDRSFHIRSKCLFRSDEIDNPF